MPYIPYSKNGKDPLQKLLGHNPALLQHWTALLDSFYQDGELDPDLREEVRKAVAYGIGCAYCMSHGCPSPVITDPKTEEAVRFAKKVIDTKKEIEDSDIERLRQYFNDTQISELCAFICYGTGLARFGAILRVDPS